MANTEKNELRHEFLEAISQYIHDTKSNRPNNHLKSLVENCRANVKVGSKVRVYRDGDILKQGTVVRLTTMGAYVFSSKADPSEAQGDVNPETAEWFAFSNNLGGMILV